MLVTLGHAIYGERDRGHRLLAASASFPNPDGLAGRMDLRGTPPPYTTWSPYLSGFRWDGHYVFARTMPDPRATRAGMVFSRAFALPEAQASMLRNIAGLFELLEELGDGREAIDDLCYDPTTTVPGGGTGLAQALLAEGPDPVVWPGEDGFAAALASLWSALWPAARLGLSFRIAFSPTDVASDPPTLVTTPDSLVSRWSAFRIVRLDAPPVDGDVAEKLLVGHRTPPALAHAIDGFGAGLPKVAALRQLVGLADLTEAGGSLADFIDALRLVTRLAPEPSQGAGIKDELIAGAVKSMATATPAEVRMARNLDLAPIAARKAFWTALTEWAQARPWRDPDAGAAAAVIEDAYSDKPVADWRDAVAQGLRQALGKPAAALAEALWAIIAVRPALLGRLVGGMKDGRRLVAAALVKQPPPTLAVAAGEAIAAQAVRLSMPAVHAMSCAASFPPLEAIRRHVRDAAADAATLALAASRATGADQLAAAIEDDGDLTLALGAAAVAKTPALARRINIGQPRWRQLWAQAIAIEPSAARGPANPVRVVASLMDGIIDGAITDDVLLDALSRTELASLLGYPRLAELWPRLPEPARRRFLAATADQWLGAVEGGEDILCDDTLAATVIDPVRLDPALARLAQDVVRGCQVARALPQLGERRFERWLDQVLARGSPLAAGEAEALGRLTAARDWSSVARRISDAITDDKRSDLRPAVDYIVDQLGWMRRYLLDETFTRTPIAAKWQILLEIAQERYGYGPADGALWQRAGGKEKDIPKGKNGAEMWRKVIDDAQRGRGAINIGQLVRLMYSEYPHHAALSKLRWDTAFGESR